MWALEFGPVGRARRGDVKHWRQNFDQSGENESHHKVVTTVLN